VVEDADEFFSAVSSLSENINDEDVFFECPFPYEPLVGS
jgi:hypothetical protein